MIYDPKELEQMVKTIKKSNASTTQEGQEGRKSPNTDMEELVRGAKIGAQKRLEAEAKAQRPYRMLHSSLTDVGEAIVKGTTPSSDVDPYLQHKMVAPATFTIDVPSKHRALYDANNYAYYLQKKHNAEQEKLRNDMLSSDAISQFGSPQMHIDQGDRMYYKDVADAAYEINKGLGLPYIGEDGRTYSQAKSNLILRTEYGKTNPEASGYEFDLGVAGYATEQIAKEAAKKAQELAKQYTNGEAYTKVNGTLYSQNDLANYFFGQIMEVSHNQRIQVDTDYQDYIFNKTYGKDRKDVMRERVAEIRNELKALQHQAGETAYWDKKHEVENYLATNAGGVETILRIPRSEALTAETLAEKPYDDLLEQLDAWEQNDFSSSFASAFDWANFFSLGMADVIAGGNINNALENARKGYYLSDSEKALVKMVQLTQELQSYRDKLYAPQSTWSMIGEGLGGTLEAMPEFALGMIGTGGIGTGVKYKAVQAAKRFMTNKTIANAAGMLGHGAIDLGKWVGVNYARGMAATPMMPMFYKGVLDGYNSQYHFEGDNLVYTPKNKATIWAGAYIDTVNEFASEGMGANIGDVVGLGLKGTGRMLGITKKANKSVTGATTRKFFQAPMKESTKKFLKDLGYSGSLTGEWTGEMLGDFMSQWQRYMVGAEYDFEHFKDFDSWLTTIGVSAIMGGTMTTLGGGMTIYQETKMAKDIAQNRERIINKKIQDAALRDKLRMLSEVDDPMLAASELANYFNTHNIENASDIAYALDYIMLNSQLKVLMGDVQEQERMVKFEAKRAEIEGKAYHGADGKSTRNVVIVRDAEGNAYYVLKGDMANKEAMLELMDVNTGEMTTKVASAVTKPEYASVDSLLINAYGNMFSLEEEVSRVKDVTGALSSVEKPTMEHVETTATQLDITLPKKGDVVTMVDGRTAEITEDLGDGTYIAQRKASLTGLSETITLPFDAIRSNDSLTAKAQETILNSGVESAVDATSTPQPTAEVQTPVESATPQPTTQTTSGVSVGAVIVAPNGEQARVVEINDDGTVTLNYNLNEGASMADAAIEVVRMDDLTKEDGSDASANVPTTTQTEMPAPAVPQPVAETPTTDAVDAAQNVEVVPTQQDGAVDFDAIEDPAQCAQMMAAMLGGPENALAIVEESIEAVKAEMDKAVKAKAPTINEGVAKQNKINEIKARLIRYEQIAFELEQMMKPAEAKAENMEHEAGLVENEHTAGLPEGMRKSIDEMAKRAKVRIEFVDERIKGDAEQKGNLIRVSTRNRTKAVEVLVGHELLHFMKSKMPEAYKAFKEAVIAFIGKDKFAKEVARRKKAYAAQNVKLNDEDAAEEIVADYAGFLVQGRDVFEKFIEPKKSDNVFLRGLKKGLEYIRNIFGANGMTKQVKAVDNMVDALNTLINATVEGKDIEKREETTAEEAKGEDNKTDHSLKVETEEAVSRIEENIGEVDIKRGDVKYALRDVLPETEVEQAVQDLMRVTGRSRGTVERYLKAEQSLAKFILSGDNAAYLDYEADDSVPSIWENSDYPQGTVEFSNICRKRLPLTMIYQKLQKEFPNTKFNKTQLETIRQTLIANGIDVACGLCFVEDRRQHNDEIGQGFIDALSGKDVYVNANQQKAIDKLRESGDDYIPNLYELLTLDGMKKLRMEHPEVANAFIKYNNARGQQAGRLFQAYSAYHREILKFNTARVKKTNDVGGLRIFSFSDFEAHHLIDLVQVLTDCARKGIKVQGYTKVPEFALAVKDTNMKLNRSLIAKDNGVVEADYSPKKGEAVSPNVIDGKRLLLDTVEGIDVTDKNFFDSSASKNVGNILVGVNDEQIRIAMLDPFVDYIIPFHTGLSADILKQKGISDWKNYKYEQIEKTIVDGKMVNAKTHVNIYTDVLSDDIKTEKQFVERYLEVCKEKNLVPKFARFLNRDKAGNFVYTKGYYKFLLDFKMFDAKGRILPQEVVQPIFNDVVNKQILDDYVKGEKAKAPNEELYEEVKEALGLGGQTKFSLQVPAEELAEIEAERKAIFETAKANGTYLKAPNGKDTNLTPEQWVTVRTSRFKKWFGDWELAALYNRAIEAWNNKDSKGKVVFGLSNRAKARFAELLGKDIKQLVITDDAIRHIKKKHSEREELRGQKNVTPEDVVIIPYLINNYDSMELSPEFDDSKGNRAITIKKHINGVSVVATIEKGDNKEFLVTSYQFVKSDALDASKETPELNVRNDSDIAKVQKDIENIKSSVTNSSKIVDENGEPKVVWHGTPKGGFTVFNTNPKGKTQGTGAWFASDRSNAVTYSGRNYVEFDTPSTIEDLYNLIENNEAYENIKIKEVFYIKDEEGNEWKYETLQELENDGWEDYTSEDIRKEYILYDGLSYMGTYTVAEESDMLNEAVAIAENTEIPMLYEVFLNIREPFIVDAEGKNWQELDLGSTDATAREGRYGGYDGTIIKDVEDGGDVVAYTTTDYIVHNPNQIKSATNNVGTYNANNPDIRYSLITPEMDASYLDAVERGDMATAQKMVMETAEKAGYTEKVYHGTSQFGFTSFSSYRPSGATFTTDNPLVSEGYGNGVKGYRGRVRNINKPLKPVRTINDAIYNARSVFNEDWRLATEEEKRRVIVRVEEDARKMRDEIKARKVDMPEELRDNVMWIENIVYYLAEARYDGIKKEELSNRLREYYRLYQKSKEALEIYITNLLTEGQKEYLRFLIGDKVGDVAIGIGQSYANAIIENDLATVDGNYLVNMSTLEQLVKEAKRYGSYQLYGNLGRKPLEIDADHRNWNNLDFNGMYSTDVIVEWAKENGYTSVVFKNIYDGGPLSNVKVFYDSNQLKSADPVTYDDNGDVIPLSERFNPEEKDIRYSLMQPTNEEVTFDNFFKNTSAVFEVLPKSEVPQREPDYTSERWDGFGVSSRYWYGEDGLGKYVIRESNHWSDYPQGERTREAFEAEPYNKRYTRISSCRWALAVSKEQVTTEKDSYLDGDKMYGKAYLDEFTKWEDVRYSLTDPTTDRFNRIVALTKQLASDFNIPCPILISDTKAEFTEMIKDCLGVTPKDAENDAGFYSEKDELIGVNSAILATRGDLRETLLHEYAHHISLKHLTSKIADIVKVIGEDNIREAHQGLLGEAYKYKSAEATINEFISFLVEKLTIAKTYAIFAEEMSVDDYISELKDYIVSDEEITHKDVLIKVLPLVKDNIELQREQYGKERTSTIVIPRRATQALVSSPQEGSTQAYGNKEGRSRPIEAGSRVQEIDRRGEGKDAQRVNYSLSDIPFFDAEGNAIDMSAISEAKALEMIDGRVRDMMAYDYDKSVIDIANQAKKDRRATRAYYAEERRKRRGGNEAPRTNVAKIDELFADTNINSLPLEVQALIFIAEGRAKIRWADKDGKRGLASELGLANSASDKAAMKSVWSGAEQSFDEVVHGWWESINGYERGIDTQDLRNALIEALMSFPSAKAAMRELQTQYDAIATAEREALEEIDRREAADLDRVKREYEERSARFEMSEGDERESMREMAVEHYSSQPLSAADEALEELTDKLNKMERRAERLMLNQKSGYRELAESIEKSKEVIIRTLEHLRMFSGMEQIHIDEVAKLINMTRTARSKRQVEAVATKAKNLIQRIAIRKARENMRRLLDLKLSNVEVIQQILKESNTLPREKRDALLKSLWKVSRNGWRATKAMHPDTKEIFKELNDLIKEYKKSVKDKEVATIKQTIADRLVSLEAEIHPDVEVDDKGNVMDNAGLPTDFNDSNRNIALHLFKSYLEVEAKNVAYSEANKTLRETDKGSEKFGEALSNMYVAREDYLSALKQFNATLEDVIVNGKDKLRDFNIEKEKHEVALRSMAIKAIGGKKASGQGKRANALQWARAGINATVNLPYWTFETVLERIDRLSPYKKGEFYNYFMRKYTDANAKLYTSYTAHMESIGSAMARCFPDMAKQFGIIGRNPYEIYKAVMRKAEATALGTLKYKEDGIEREMQLTVANAMYIVAMWRQPRYREAMEGNGITEGAINNLMQSINKEHAGYINFMDWVNTALLPNTRLEYDEVYRKLNGGSLAKEENYFPARVVTHEDVKLDENGKGQLPSSPSALKERISHKQMPKMGTDYFKVLEAHIQDMDKWAAFAELTADLNVILSSDEFRRRLNEFMPGIGGDGGGKGSLYKMLYDTALIATGNYHNSGENVFGPIQKAWATSNIAFRLWTAVKQISSVSVGVTEHVYFVKHMLATSTVAGIAYEWDRAMTLSPSLRYRWQSKAAGMEALMRETSRGDGYAQYRGGVVKTYDALKDMADKAVKLGMTPNALVDAIACSILVNSVYDKAIHNMTKGKREATEEERKEAIRKAEIAFNSTQQSSEGAYLSAVQANPFYAPLTTYMNASFALHRKRMSGIHELWKLMTSKEYKRFLKDEYGVDAAKISAKDAFADIIRGIVGDLAFAAMGWGLMEVMSAVYEWLGGDGDDDDTEAEKEAFFKTYWLPVFNGFLGGSQITSLFQGYDTSMTPAYDEFLEDVGGIFDGKGSWRVEVAQAATKYGLGIDIKSLYRIGAGLKNMVAEEKGENAGSILMFLNAPNKYIKAFVGDRREGETLQQYQTRIICFNTLFDNVMHEELHDENGEYIGEGAPSMIMSQTQAKALKKEYEPAKLKDIATRYGSWDEYKAMMNTEKLYKDICEFIGVTPDAQPSKVKLRNTVYSTGEYVAPVYGLSQEEHSKLLSQESYIFGAHYHRTRWIGDDEGYYDLLKEEYRLKNELIDKYNEYIK